MISRHKSFRPSAQRGQAIILVALAMLAMLVFAVLAIDGGRAYMLRQMAQNTSDMTALAGISRYVKDHRTTEAAVWAEIANLAQQNAVPDPANNLKAWWVDGSGSPIAANRTIDKDSNQTAPPGTQGVKVQVQIPYDTFVGSLIGQSELVAQAESVATSAVQPVLAIPSTYDDAIWVGGGDQCVDGSTLSFIHSDAQNIYYHASVHVDGSFGVANPNRIDIDGSFEVRAWAGSSSTGASPFTQANPYNNSPYAGFNFHNPTKGYIGPASPSAPARTGRGPNYPLAWAHENIHDLSTRLVDAASFQPGVNGAGGGRLYRDYAQIHGPAEADAFFHTITGASPVERFQNFANAYQSYGKGIYWADGDVTVSADNFRLPDATLIVNGRFSTFDPETSRSSNNFHLGTAGSGARNISLLAGSRPDFPHGCATNPLDAVVRIGGQEPMFDGIVYVPYGQSAFGGNFNAGSDHLVAQGIVTYSLRLGAGPNDKGNNQQFAIRASLFTVEQMTIKLLK